MIPTQTFGRTGHESTRVLFGAAALGAMSQDRADATIAQVVEAGINHFDTAAGYGDSEILLAPWLSEHRDEIFLATKTGQRSGDAARAELEKSLTRMGVGNVDLIQLHNLVEDAEWEIAHDSGGAVEAMIAARDEGLVKHIGVTGHGVRIPGMHLRSLEAFDYDSVLFPYNLSMLDNPAYRHDVEQLLAVCAERNVAVQTIKSIACGRWPADYEGRRFSWYEPLTDPEAIARATSFVLGQPNLYVNSTSDATKLAMVFDAAKAFGEGVPAATADEVRADMDTYGVTPLFDGSDLERI